jgi:hypothetical protein
MTLNLKGNGEDVPTPTPLEGMMVSPPVRTTLEVVSPETLNLKGKEMPAHATTLEGPDSDAAACPAATNSLNPTNPAINTG